MSGDVVCGVNSSGKIYCKNKTDSTWTNVSGTLSNISVSSDGSLYGVNSSGLLYYKPSYTTTTGWKQLSTPVTLNSISASNNVICGVNTSSSKAYCSDTNITTTPTWYEISQPFDQLSVSQKRLAGVDTSDKVYMSA